jgi:hypothetical protein
MPEKSLTPELINLIHHTELNKIGWWNRSLQQLITSVLWLTDKDLSEAGLERCLNETFHLDVDLPRLRSQCQELKNKGTVIEQPTGDLRLSQAGRNRLEQELAEAQECSNRAKDRFVQLVKEYCPSIEPDKLWDVFQTKLLVPLVTEIGARTYELVSGSQLDLDTTVRFPEFLRSFEPHQRPEIRKVILTFLNPGDADIRSYILRHLNAYFSVQAGRLSDSTIEALSRSLKNPPTFKVFVDTNFLFSFLEIHENPSNEAAKSLVELTRQIKTKVPCRFYVSPETVDEFKRVVNAQKDFLQGLVLPPNLAQVALEMDLSGVALRFIEFNRTVRQPVSAENYFAPYLEDLIPTLRAKDVDLFNDAMDAYSLRQDVIDDILEQQRFEYSKYGEKAKSYAQLRHDVVLWHFCKDKRPVRVESPIDAVFWVVTVDYHFLGFDFHKRSTEGASIPICVHPTSLIQLLQFWLPRTSQFEEAMLDSFRLPLMFQEFDPSAESVTVNILKSLARFANAEQLTTDTVSNILVNQALRQGISSEPNVERQIELVHGALVEENQRAIAYAKVVEQQKEKLSAEVSGRNQELEALRRQLDLQSEQLRHFKQELETAATAAQQPKVTPSQISEPPDVAPFRRERAYFSACFTFLLLLLLFLLGAVIHWKAPAESFAKAFRSGCSIIFIFWILALNEFGKRSDAINEWPIFRRFQEFKNWLIGLLVFLTGWLLFEPVIIDVKNWVISLFH